MNAYCNRGNYEHRISFYIVVVNDRFYHGLAKDNEELMCPLAPVLSLTFKLALNSVEDSTPLKSVLVLLRQVNVRPGRAADRECLPLHSELGRSYRFEIDLGLD